MWAGSTGLAAGGKAAGERGGGRAAEAGRHGLREGLALRPSLLASVVRRRPRGVGCGPAAGLEEGS